MTQKAPHISLLILSVCLLTIPGVKAQYIANPSLEGEPGTDIVPPGWATDHTWSNPNFYDANDFDPTGTGNYYAPIDGNTYALFRSRGATYSESFFAPYQREYLYQELIQPLDTNSCYKFSAWMCYNPAHQVNDTEYPDTAMPLKFQVWGGLGPNTRTELLVDSDPVRNTTWQDFDFYFNTNDVSYPYILLEVQWDTINVFPRAYNGYVLVDDLRMEYLGSGNTVVIEDTLYYRGDGEMTITPYTEGIEYAWEPTHVVSDPEVQSPIITEYTEDLLVQVSLENECPVIEKYHLILDCDTMYPTRINDTVSFFFKYEDNLQLNASDDGTAWHWQPEEFISDPDIQSPYLLEFTNSLLVEITDRYGCEFVDLFNIIWNCDTVYPGGQITLIDTLLTEEDLKDETEFELIPLTGHAPLLWWNTTRYMECLDCIYPTVIPRSTTTYTIDLEDEYGCAHREIFHFEVPFRIPNVITPNGDGSNDCFIAYGLPPGTSLRLFDKAGHFICEVPDYETLDCWSGTDNQGKALKTGTYWYAFVNEDSGTLTKGFLFIKR